MTSQSKVVFLENCICSLPALLSGKHTFQAKGEGIIQLQDFAQVRFTECGNPETTEMVTPNKNKKK